MGRIDVMAETARAVDGKQYKAERENELHDLRKRQLAAQQLRNGFERSSLALSEVDEVVRMHLLRERRMELFQLREAGLTTARKEDLANEATMADLYEEEEKIYIELQRLEALYHRVIEDEDFFELELKNYHTADCSKSPLQYRSANEYTRCIQAECSTGTDENMWLSNMGEVGISSTDETEESSVCHDPITSFHLTFSEKWQEHQNEDSNSVTDNITSQHHYDDTDQAKAPDYFSAHSSPSSCIDISSEKHSGNERSESPFSSCSYGDVVQVPSTETEWHECYQEDSSVSSHDS